MTPFYKQLQIQIDKLGGMHNAHIHLDRAGTLESHFWEVTEVDPDVVANASLAAKHSMIQNLHAGPAYEKDNLKNRVNEYLDMMVAVNTRRAEDHGIGCRR